MQWWCAAQNVAWTWTWRPYPGVWLFVLAVAFAWIRLHRRAKMRPARSRTAVFTVGLLLMWIALDWPIGALGAGYMASLHMVQFLVLALIAPPLMLIGASPAIVRVDSVPAPIRSVLRFLTSPVVALMTFTAILLATHLPTVTDRLMPTQLGAFAIDTLWLAGGVLYWWPVLVPRPRRARFSYPVKMAYLFASMVIMTAPGAMITFSDLPIYATYELAPPIPGVSPLEDQRIAGIGMRFGGALVAWIAISILFLRWTRAEEQLMREEARPRHL